MKHLMKKGRIIIVTLSKNTMFNGLFKSIPFDKIR